MKFWDTPYGGFLWLGWAVLRLYEYFEDSLENTGYEIEDLRQHCNRVSVDDIVRLQSRLWARELVKQSWPSAARLRYRFPATVLEDMERGFPPKGCPLDLRGLRC